LTKATLIELCNWTHEQRQEKQKCFCGKFANYGKPIGTSISRELLCSQHYKEKESQCHTQKQEIKKEKYQLNLL
tara:strand:+ start:792 stop:1013 length:222 start_codon:yes stop_codon:yes gene_type:complete